MVLRRLLEVQNMKGNNVPSLLREDWPTTPPSKKSSELQPKLSKIRIIEELPSWPTTSSQAIKKRARSQEARSKLASSKATPSCCKKPSRGRAPSKNFNEQVVVVLVVVALVVVVVVVVVVVGAGVGVSSSVLSSWCGDEEFQASYLASYREQESFRVWLQLLARVPVGVG